MDNLSIFQNIFKFVFFILNWVKIGLGPINSYKAVALLPTFSSSPGGLGFLTAVA